MYRGAFPFSTKIRTIPVLTGPSLKRKPGVWSVKQHGTKVEESFVRSYLGYLVTTGHPVASSFRAADIRLLGRGNNNQLYELVSDRGVYVLKIYPIGRERRMRLEWEALRVLEPLRVAPVPVLGEVHARYLEAPTLIYRKISGAPLEMGHLTSVDMDRLQTVWNTIQGIPVSALSLLREPAGPSTPLDCLVSIDGNLHELRQGGAQHDRRLKEGIENLLRLRRGYEGISVADGLWQDARLSLCQVDNQPRNILQDEQGVLWLIDWEHAGLMDPACEVASFFCHPEGTVVSTQNRLDCIRMYVEQTGDRKAFDKITGYLRVLPLQWLARSLKAIQNRPMQPVQPWITFRSVDELWEDHDKYLKTVWAQYSGALLHR